MAHIYRPFFLFYGLAHIVAGALIWLWPAATGTFLIQPLVPAAATLLGFMSILAGLGWLAATRIESVDGRRTAVLLAIGGNIINYLAHLQNVLRGASPLWLAVVAGMAIGAMVVLLIFVYFDLSRQGGL